METLGNLKFTAFEELVLLDALRAYTTDGPYPEKGNLKFFRTMWALSCLYKAVRSGHLTDEGLTLADGIVQKIIDASVN